MARPNPAIAQRKSDPNSTQIMALGRVVACRASLVVTSTFFGIVILHIHDKLLAPQGSIDARLAEAGPLNDVRHRSTSSPEILYFDHSFR